MQAKEIPSRNRKICKINSHGRSDDFWDFVSDGWRISATEVCEVEQAPANSE